jgi:all-trans-retinol 13,14-reductase
MNEYDVAIIGSGLGGLVCGAILSMEGYRVCVLEKNRQTGGCLQTYSRDKTIIDTGVHYIGALGEGQTLNRIFSYLGIMQDLKLKQLDDDGFDIICFGDEQHEYKLAQGYARYKASLLQDFPEEEAAIDAYCDKIRAVCDKFPLYNLRKGDHAEKEDVLGIDTATWIAGITGNVRLQQVLAGNNLLYAGVAGQTPFYIHALITNSYIESAWKCIDGGSQIARLLGRRILANGGVIKKNSKVTAIAAPDKEATHIVLEDGSIIKAKYFISGLHPAQTIAMTESPLLRPAYRHRMAEQENTIGPFLVNVVLRKKTVPYFNHNYYYHTHNNAWDGIAYRHEEWPLTYALFAGAISKDPEYAETVTIMTYMRYADVCQWADTFNTDTYPSARDEVYQSFKKEKAEALLDLVARRSPWIKEHRLSYYVATPLTYRDYQGTADGSMYGIAKDHKTPYRTFIPARTKIPNLFLTGQNLNLHGILGVTISALSTCAELMDIEQLLERINKA